MADSEDTIITEEDVFNNDIDPLDGIRQLRKEEASEVEVSPELEEAANEEAALADENNPESNTDDDNVDEFEEDVEAAEKPAVTKTEDGEEENSELPSSEDEGKTEAEDNLDSEENTETSPALSLTDKRKFNANGQEFEFSVEEMLEQFGSVFAQSMD